MTIGVRSAGRKLFVAALATALLAVGGCATSGGTKDLVQALEETRSGVRSASQAVDLLADGRTTRAAAEVTVSDMADQITTAYSAAADVPPESAELEQARATTLGAISAAQIAVLGVAAVLSSGDGALGAQAASLERADAEVSEVLRTVAER